jgi:hypothetical protein
MVEHLNMVVGTSAGALYDQTGSGLWNCEQAIINLVADFVSSLP